MNTSMIWIKNYKLKCLKTLSSEMKNKGILEAMATLPSVLTITHLIWNRFGPHTLVDSAVRFQPTIS